MSLALLIVIGTLIANYWSEIAHRFAESDPIKDTQAAKQWLFLFEGVALVAQNFAVSRIKGYLWLKILSGIALLGWAMFMMLHLVIGAGIIS